MQLHVTILLFLHRMRWGASRNFIPKNRLLILLISGKMQAFSLKMVGIRHLYKHRASKHTHMHTQEHFYLNILIVRMTVY